MEVYISKEFSKKIATRSKDEILFFNEKIKVLKNMNKSEIVDSNDIVKLTEAKQLIIYAYHIQESIYILFTLMEKNKLVLLDEIELLGKGKIKSLVYPEEFESVGSDG